MMIYSTEPIQNGTLRYRIEMRQCGDGSWQQRHIWLDGSQSYGRTQVGDCADEWIPTMRGIAESFCRRNKAVAA